MLVSLPTCLWSSKRVGAAPCDADGDGYPGSVQICIDVDVDCDGGRPAVRTRVDVAAAAEVITDWWGRAEKAILSTCRAVYKRELLT